jgi:hypothetical protein
MAFMRIFTQFKTKLLKLIYEVLEVEQQMPTGMTR